MWRSFFVLLFCVGPLPILLAQEDAYLTIPFSDNQDYSNILQTYGIYDSCNLKHIQETNAFELENSELKELKVPIILYKYNGKSIRSTVGITDFQLAKSIQQYNEHLFKTGLKENGVQKDQYLYVPYSALTCGYLPTETILQKPKEIPEKETLKHNKETIVYPLFGPDSEEVILESEKLKGKVFYIVSGHGGPDPGAIGTYENEKICEDEYAYDIALRLSKNLMKHGAIVHPIIQEKKEGIRDERILSCDYDEKALDNSAIPKNQLARLQQRADIVNELYLNYKKNGVTDQQLLVLHIDSRAKDKRIDMFFYYNKKSKKGKALATHLRNTIESKYAAHQKSRGYNGQLHTRNLYMLKKTLPPTVYMELGNIQNEKDQKRLVLESNRQAVANWLSEGILTF